MTEDTKKVIWADFKAEPLAESSNEVSGVVIINTKTGDQSAELFPSVPNYDNLHLGRSFSGHWLEDDCPCPQEACGLVRWDRAVPECDQHSMGSSKTMRQGHQWDKCPGAQHG